MVCIDWSGRLLGGLHHVRARHGATVSGDFLNFGAGQNQLPEPWQNLNASHDIRKPLRFADCSVKAILAEHVVEHVSFLSGVSFFRECSRVLEFDGVLRVAFPDISRFVCRSLLGGVGIGGTTPFAFSASAITYAELMEGAELPENMEQFKRRYRGHLENMLTGYGHQMAWTRESAAGVLLCAGFAVVVEQHYGRGALQGVDGHHLAVGRDAAVLETTILEATK